MDTNNTINEFGDEFDAGFDATMRRHLKRANTAAAPACAGFDPELANAYVESALGAAARTRYEAHLADCATCRCHVVELFRLMPREEQAVPASAEAATAAKPDSWWAGVSRRFDFTGWRWNAAALAGACAVVLLALTMPLVWRQSFTKPASEVAAAKQIQEDARPAAQPSAVAITNSPAGNVATDSLQKRQEDKTVAKESSQKAKDAPVAQPAGSPPAPAVTPVTGRDPAVTNQQAVRRMQENSYTRNRQFVSGPSAEAQNRMVAPQSQTADAGARRGEAQSEAAKAAGAATDAVARKPAPAESREDKSKKSEADEKVEPEKVAKSDSGVKLEAPKPTPLPGTASAYKDREKEEAKAPAVSASGLASPMRARQMNQRVGNKTFIYEKGVWRDTSYDPKEKKWPVIRLSRSSEEYERTLADIPALRQFFKLGPVIVLWQGTVYEVGVQ